jgi:hypothetical protein
MSIFADDCNEFVWDGDGGLGNAWGTYYKCPDAEFIQCIRMSLTDAVVWKEFAGSLGNASSGLPAEATIPQAPDDATWATTVSSSISSLTPGSLSSGVMQASSTHSDELQAALDKHWEDTLHFLWVGPASGKPAVPPKMLHKIRAANMETMTNANFLTSHAGGGELSTHKLKELGQNAEKKAMECFKGEVAGWNAMDHELPPTVNLNNAQCTHKKDKKAWMTRVLMSVHHWQQCQRNKGGNTSTTAQKCQVNRGNNAGAMTVTTPMPHEGKEVSTIRTTMPVQQRQQCPYTVGNGTSATRATTPL